MTFLASCNNNQAIVIWLCCHQRLPAVKNFQLLITFLCDANISLNLQSRCIMGLHYIWAQSSYIVSPKSFINVNIGQTVCTTHSHSCIHSLFMKFIRNTTQLSLCSIDISLICCSCHVLLTHCWLWCRADSSNSWSLGGLAPTEAVLWSNSCE